MPKAPETHPVAQAHVLVAREGCCGQDENHDTAAAQEQHKVHAFATTSIVGLQERYPITSNLLQDRKLVGLPLLRETFRTSE